MSLERIKNLYCIAVIAIAIVLDCTGEMIGWATAVVMLAGALPVFNCATRIAANQEKQRTLEAVTDVVAPPSHQDIPLSVPAVQDHLTSERSS